MIWENHTRSFVNLKWRNGLCWQFIDDDEILIQAYETDNKCDIDLHFLPWCIIINQRTFRITLFMTTWEGLSENLLLSSWCYSSAVGRPNRKDTKDSGLSPGLKSNDGRHTSALRRLVSVRNVCLMMPLRHRPLNHRPAVCSSFSSLLGNAQAHAVLAI